MAVGASAFGQQRLGAGLTASRREDQIYQRGFDVLSNPLAIVIAQADLVSNHAGRLLLILSKMAMRLYNATEAILISTLQFNRNHMLIASMISELKVLSNTTAISVMLWAKFCFPVMTILSVITCSPMLRPIFQHLNLKTTTATVSVRVCVKCLILLHLMAGRRIRGSESDNNSLVELFRIKYSLNI